MPQIIKRILLFMPPAFTGKHLIDINPAPPLGLGYLASALEEMGKEVMITDCLLEGWNNREEVDESTIRIGLSADEIRRIIKDFDPDVVGVNSQFTRQYKNAHMIYRIAKEVSQDIITIAGGPHPTVMPDFALEDPDLDYVVMGEGERALQELISALESDPDSSESIDGIGFRKNGKVVIKPKTEYIEDLDTLPFPAWHLMNIEGYFGLEISHGIRHHTRFFSIITSRGCPAKCVFCTAKEVWGKKYRARSAEKVLEEIVILKERFGVEEILVEDDNFTFDISRAEKICDMIIKKDLNLHFDTPNGVAAYRLTPELLSKMQKAGFFKVNFAIESANQKALLKVIKKPLRLDHMETLIRHCRKINLDFGVFFIIGIPDTTLQEMWDNYRFCRRMKIYDPFISVATPYPGSELYEICRDEGYLCDDFSLENLYIRTFSIKTPEWSKHSLSALLSAGWIYLKVFQFFNNPVDFSRRAGEYMKMRFHS